MTVESVASLVGLAVSIFSSAGDGSRGGGLLAFLVGAVVALAGGAVLLDCCGLDRDASDFFAGGLLRGLATEEADEEDEDQEEREEEEEEEDAERDRERDLDPLLELLAEELT